MKGGETVVHRPENEKWVSDGMAFDWTMQGRDFFDIPFQLQLCFVQLPDGRQGVTLGEGTSLPIEIETTSFQPEDVTVHHGRIVWLKGMNGLAVEFEGDLYSLFEIVEVSAGVGGKLYFHFMSGELDPAGKGEVVWSEEMFQG